MRSILFVGLSTVFLGLVAWGVLLVVERRTRAVPRGDEDPLDEHEPPPRSQGAARPRRLPNLVSPACVPRPGRGCLRGRLLLSDGVAAAWKRARAAAEADEQRDRDDAHASVDDDDDGDSDGEVVTATLDETAAAGDSASRQEDPTAALLLPPAGSFSAFFEVRAVPWADEKPPSAPVILPATGDVGADADDITARVEADGQFALELPPGRYDLEAASADNLLVGGLDGLRVQAGDARAALDLAVAPPVEIAGRVVDGDGVAADVAVEFHRTHRRSVVTAEMRGAGRFVMRGLRAGSYAAEVKAAGFEDLAIELSPPLTGVELHVERLPAALLLLSPDNDNACGDARVVLVSQGVRRERRGAYFQRCQAVIKGVRPGSSWTAAIMIGGVRRDRTVTLGFGRPLTPVCLDSGCSWDTAAALNVRVVDVGGDLVDDAELEVRDTVGADGAATVTFSTTSTGWRAGTAVSVRARRGSLEAATTVWLATGVNDVIVRLPGLASKQAQ